MCSQTTQCTRSYSNFTREWLIDSAVLHSSLWTDLFKPACQAIIQDVLDQTSTGTQKHTQHALADLGSLSAEQDVAAYVWAEAPSDTPGPAAWKGGGGLLGKQAGEPSGLYMKARAFTPRTQG